MILKRILLEIKKSNIIYTLKEKDMPRFFVKNNQVDNDKIVITGEDVKHKKCA